MGLFLAGAAGTGRGVQPVSRTQGGCWRGAAPYVMLWGHVPFRVGHSEGMELE